MAGEAYLKNGERNKNMNQTIDTSLFSWSPWLTTLLSALAGPSVFILIGLRVGAWILNCMDNYGKWKINPIKVIVLRNNNNTLEHGESTMWLIH